MRWIALVLVVLPCACAVDDSELRHGVVKLGFMRGVSEDASPFVATAEVIATLEYDECLVEFYANNPNMRQDGVDGELVFGPLADGGEGWMDRLCDGSSEHAQCEVVSIEQELDVGIPRLTVVYAITGDLEGRELRFGPLPKAELSDCQGESLPEVRMGRVSGVDINGSDLWSTETFDPSSAVVDQGGAIAVYAAHE